MTTEPPRPAVRASPGHPYPARSALTIGALAGYADRALVGLMLATAFALPLVFSTAGPDVFALPKSATLWVVSAVAATLLALRLAAQPRTRPRTTPVWLLTGAWLLLNVAAWWLSIDRGHSLLGESLQYQGFVSVLCYALALAVAATTLRGRFRVRLLLVAIVVGAIPVAAYAVLQWFRLDPIWPDFPKGRAFSTLGQANTLGAYLVIAIAATAGLFGSFGRASRSLLVLVGLLLTAAIAVTLSRGAYVGLLAVVIVIAVIAGAPIAGGIRLASRRVLIVAAVLVVAGWVAVVPRLEPFVQRAASTVDLTEGSIRGHFDLWAVAARIVAEHPLLGTGQDTYVLEFGRLRDVALTPDRAAVMAKFRPESPHNVYLAIAGASGLPSLAAYLGIVILAVTGKLRRARTGPARVDRWLLAALFAMIAGHLVTDSFVTADVTSTWLFWVVLGVAVGWSSSTDSPGDRFGDLAAKSGRAG